MSPTSPKTPIKILWFRRDLRIHDNWLLGHLKPQEVVLPVFVFDHHILSHLPSDDRRVGFIFEQVMALKKALQDLGLDLAVFYGEVMEVFAHIATKYAIDSICASSDYDAYALGRDEAICKAYTTQMRQDTYIFAPHDLLKPDGTPYVVFTPFYAKAKAFFAQNTATLMHLHKPTPQTQIAPMDFEHLLCIKHNHCHTLPLQVQSLGFRPKNHQVAPLKDLLQALPQVLHNYATDRDIPHKGASGLSVYLRFGTLGVRELLHILKDIKGQGIDTEPFFRQLAFRDFYAYLLFHFPHVEHDNFKGSFRGTDREDYFEAFCAGQTGIPLVDAGVHELCATGTMNNRVRMVVASVFTKHLLLPWQKGEAFFKAHLMDYDTASNVLSWQWASSTGVDAQPYFRVFNPYLQSKKFDPQGVYIKSWLPHTKGLEPKQIHDEKYWLDHHKPIVEQKQAAQKAKNAFQEALRGC